MKEQGNGSDRVAATRAQVGAALAAWFTVVFVAGAGGAFQRVPPVWFGPLVMAGILLPVAVYYRSAAFRAFFDSVPPERLVWLNLWRLPAGLVFLYYGGRGLLPEGFVRNAAHGDIAVGLAAPLAALWRGGRGRFLVFHAFGMADFVLAVGTGLAFTLLRVPLMENIRAFPVVLIPLFGVGVTGALHVMALDTLLRRRREARPRFGTPSPSTP